MQLRSLPEDWMSTRASLQAHAQAVTALPRAAAPLDPRWSHVAMVPHPAGFSTHPTPLADGTELVSVIDLEEHRVLTTAGDDVVEVDLQLRPSSVAVGSAALDLAARHGSEIDVDRERLGTDDPLDYEPAHAAAFLDASQVAVTAFAALESGLAGETAGPHLWPHGFDIAMEWFSEQLVRYDGSQANAQIATGWYPSDDSYVYVNPWPFRDDFAQIELPGGATWHFGDWKGARLDVPTGGGVTMDLVIELGTAVHEATADRIGR
jgi:hypothetical protein